jgi:hypothetical protein
LQNRIADIIDALQVAAGVPPLFRHFPVDGDHGDIVKLGGVVNVSEKVGLDGFDQGAGRVRLALYPAEQAVFRVQLPVRRQGFQYAVGKAEHDFAGSNSGHGD